MIPVASAGAAAPYPHPPPRRIARAGDRGTFAATLMALAVAAGCGGGASSSPDHGDSGGTCGVDSDCSDGVFCNGRERCAPDDPAADAMGCLPPTDADPCLEGQTCDEAGCNIGGDGFTRYCGRDCDDTNGAPQRQRLRTGRVRATPPEPRHPRAHLRSHRATAPPADLRHGCAARSA